MRFRNTPPERRMDFQIRPFGRDDQEIRPTRTRPMCRQPTLETPRLVLRPFRTADADAVQRWPATGPWPT